MERGGETGCMRYPFCLCMWMYVQMLLPDPGIFAEMSWYVNIIMSDLEGVLLAFAPSPVRCGSSYK